MKKFLTKIALLFFVFIGMMAFFDFAYTSIYIHTAPRTKTQYILQLKNKHIDYVFLGSSRVRDNIDTKLVETETSGTALNLGVNGAKPDDVFLQLKLLVHNNISFKKVFIQIDYSFNEAGPSDIVGSEALPYIHTNDIIREQVRRNNPKFAAYYCIPFYRYLDNDYSIGFRASFLSAFTKKHFDFDNGFEARNDPFNDIKRPLPQTIIQRNTTFDEMDKFCRQRQIDVVYFTAPYCDDYANSNYTNLLKQKIPQLKDYSRFVTDKQYFRDCRHLNGKGADLFTKKLVEDCIKSTE